MGLSKCSSIQQRYVLCALSSLMFIVSVMSRSSVGIVVVAMVNVTREYSASEGTSKFSENQAMPFSSVSTTAPIYNWSREIQGYILSSFSWGYVVLQISGGNLSQRYGGKWIVASGTFGCAVLDILSPLFASVSPYLLIVFTCIKGIFSSTIFPGVFAMFGRWVPPQEAGFLIPLAQVGAIMGQAIGLLYSGFASDSNKLGGWPSVFYINGALGLISLIPWCILVYNSPENHPFISSNEVEHIQQSLKSDQEKANKSWIPWRHILLSRGVILICCMGFGYGWTLMLILAVIPQYIDDVLGLNIRSNSIFNGGIALSCLLIFVAVSRLSDFLIKREWLTQNAVRKSFVCLGFVSMACAFLCLTLVESTWAAIALIFVSNAFYQFLFQSLFVLPFELSRNFSGTVFGIYNTFTMLGSIASPIVADTLTTHKSPNEWKLVFYITSGLLTILGIIFPIIGSTKREEWDFTGDEENEKRLLLQER